MAQKLTPQQIASSYARLYKQTPSQSGVYNIARFYAVSGRLAIGSNISAVDDEVFSPKKKYEFSVPNIKQFHNTKGVQLTLDGKVMKEVVDKLQLIKDEYLDETLRIISEKTPVDTGRARAGWQRNGDDIINPVPYVKYLE